jgi:hypothetical protein
MPEITRIILRNSPDGLDEDAAVANGVPYRRGENESVSEFRERAAADAQRLGAETIVFGEQRRGPSNHSDQQAKSS